jgi:hypothetical protein
MIRGAHLARSIIENTCWEGLDRIFRQTSELWTKRGHQGRLVAASETSWVIDGPKVWIFEKVTPNEILTMIPALEI